LKIAPVILTTEEEGSPSFLHLRQQNLPACILQNYRKVVIAGVLKNCRGVFPPCGRQDDKLKKYFSKNFANEDLPIMFYFHKILK